MREPKLTWDDAAGAWRANCGPWVETKDGKRRRGRRRFYVGKKEKARARELMLAELRERQEAEARGLEEAGNPSVESVAELYLAHCAAAAGRGELAARTYHTHAERLGYFAAWSPAGQDRDRYGLRRAREMRGSDLQRLARAMREAGASPHYIGGVMASAQACWAWAARPEPDRTPERILPDDPFKGAKKPKIPQGQPRYATRGELAALLRFAWRQANRWTAGTRGRCMACMKAGKPAPCRRGHNPTNELDRACVLLVRLIYHAGCRPGEACRATWADFHPAEGTIVLRRHKTSAKTGKPRIVVLPPGLVRALARWRTRAAADPEILFPHRPGRSGARAWGSTALAAKVRESWRGPAIAAGAKLSPDLTLYTLRHTFVTDARPAGLTHAQVGALVGTSERMVQQTYQHDLIDALRGDAEAVRKARRKGRSGGE